MADSVGGKVSGRNLSQRIRDHGNDGLPDQAQSTAVLFRQHLHPTNPLRWWSLNRVRHIRLAGCGGSSTRCADRPDQKSTRHDCRDVLSRKRCPRLRAFFWQLLAIPRSQYSPARGAGYQCADRPRAGSGDCPACRHRSRHVNRTRDELLAAVPLALNIHWGLLPYYRGTHCTEWAFDLLGPV